MWAEALQMLDEADRLQRRFFTEVGARERHAPSWEPPVDVFSDGDDVWLFFAVPGVSADEMEVLVDEAGALIVRGERRLPLPARSGSIRRLEIPYGRFERRVSLPSGRFELFARQVDHGCLVLGLRRIA
ncbi:MAG: Hsp20/alpha crystallin family protein [Burkholderiales bacterium]|nr:Hsp20/alpha crystallin family protein [Burkholderiales bacterium]